MSCAIRFGVGNQVREASLSSTPAPVAQTDINRLKDEFASRLVVWDTVGEITTIEGELPVSQVAEFFAIPGSNLHGLAELKLELYEDPQNPVDVLNMEFSPVARLKPLGQWRVGIDKYGVPDEIDTPNVPVHWFAMPVIYKAFKLTIRHQSYAAALVNDLRIRMLMIGQVVQMQRSFSRGSNGISFLTAPELEQTTGGSWHQVREQSESRTLSISLPQMSDDDRVALWQMETRQKGQPFIVCGYPHGQTWQQNNYTFLARFADRLTFADENPNIHSTSTVLVEV